MPKTLGHVYCKFKLRESHLSELEPCGEEHSLSCLRGSTCKKVLSGCGGIHYPTCNEYKDLSGRFCLQGFVTWHVASLSTFAGTLTWQLELSVLLHCSHSQLNDMGHSTFGFPFS